MGWCVRVEWVIVLCDIYVIGVACYLWFIVWGSWFWFGVILLWSLVWGFSCYCGCMHFGCCILRWGLWLL